MRKKRKSPLIDYTKKRLMGETYNKRNDELGRNTVYHLGYDLDSLEELNKIPYNDKNINQKINSRASHIYHVTIDGCISSYSLNDKQYNDIYDEYMID